MTISAKTLFKKAIRETALFLGYDFTPDPLDARYWAPNYQAMNNLSNPFEDYQFTVEIDGRVEVRSTSLAELCLFQETTYRENIMRLASIISSISEGPDAIIGTDDFDFRIPGTPPPNFNSIDPRFNDPRGWFNFPHTTDIYRADAIGVFAGVPIPKTNSYSGYKPTPNIFNPDRFSRESYLSTVRDICSILTQICIASNIHPGICSIAFTCNSPGQNSNDYAAMDRIASSVARTYSSQLSDAGVYDIGSIITNPRPFWAHPIDGDIRDFERTTQLYSTATGIPLNGTQAEAFMAYSAQFASAFNIPNCLANGGNMRFKAIDEVGGNHYLSFGNSLGSRRPFAANYNGTRIYSDCIASFMELINLCNMILRHPPQLFLHAGMSFHNALLNMSFRQLGAQLDDSAGSYRQLWASEVNARRDLPSGTDGYNVPFQPDLTWQNIGTMNLTIGSGLVQSGNSLGVVLLAAGALLREMETPQYGNVLARAPALEMIRQDGSKTISSTIYRGYTPRDIISCCPVLRLST